MGEGSNPVDGMLKNRVAKKKRFEEHGIVVTMGAMLETTRTIRAETHSLRGMTGLANAMISAIISFNTPLELAQGMVYALVYDLLETRGEYYSSEQTYDANDYAIRFCKYDKKRECVGLTVVHFIFSDSEQTTTRFGV